MWFVNDFSSVAQTLQHINEDLWWHHRVSLWSCCDCLTYIYMVFIPIAANIVVACIIQLISEWLSKWQYYIISQMEMVNGEVKTNIWNVQFAIYHLPFGQTLGNQMCDNIYIRYWRNTDVWNIYRKGLRHLQKMTELQSADQGIRSTHRSKLHTCMLQKMEKPSMWWPHLWQYIRLHTFATFEKPKV